jgi:hypothetical protein
MKKISLILLIVITIFVLTSCVYYVSQAKFTDGLNGDIISYNGALYYRQTRTSDFEKYYYEIDLIDFNDPNNKQMVGLIPFIKSIWVIYPDELSDNVLVVRGKGISRSYFFKEGFEFPKHNEAAISKIILSEGGYESITEISDQTIVTWSDIVDYSTTIPFDSFQGDIFSCYGVLKDYSIPLYTGQFWVILFENVVYIGAERDIRSGDNKVYYKVSDEYQELFKNAMEQIPD